MQHSLLTQNIYGLFYRYASLSVLSMIGLSFYVLADTFFIANGVGSDGLAALNLVLPVYSLLNGIGLMLGMGAATRFSILAGKEDMEGGSRVYTQCLILVLAAGAAATLLGLLSSHSISVLLGASGDILLLSETYLKTMLSFSLAFLLNNLLVCFVRNDGKPNLAMAAMLIGSLSNIVLDYVFIFPMKMGMFGAAFATGLAPVISILILSTHFLRRQNHFQIIPCRLTGKETGRILSLGIPSFLTEFSSGVVMLLFNFTILSLSGSTGVAAYGIIANLALICVAVFTGIAQGMQPLVSFFFGAQREKKIRTLLFCGVILAIAFSILFYLIGRIFPEAITSLFNRDGDQKLAGIAVNGIKIYFLAFLPMGINIITAAFFASVSRPSYSFLISILRGLLAVIVFVLILPRFFDLQGVFAAVPMAECLAFLLSATLLFHWTRRGRLENSDSRQP